MGQATCAPEDLPADFDIAKHAQREVENEIGCRQHAYGKPALDLAGHTITPDNCTNCKQPCLGYDNPYVIEALRRGLLRKEK
jgi:hypothetical protein